MLLRVFFHEGRRQEEPTEPDRGVSSVVARFLQLQPGEGARVLEGYFMRIVDQRERELALINQQETLQQQVLLIFFYF